MKFLCTILLSFIALACLSFSFSHAAETIWIEAEHLRGVRGSCFPDMNGVIKGAWGLSGPGIGAEWTQGGESEWLSIACGPDEDKASANYRFEVPSAGEFILWVRYRDYRNQTELFRIHVDQPAQPKITLEFGKEPVVDEDDEMKLFWKSAFGWDSRKIKLKKGQAILTLLAHVKQKVHRQVDCFCLTTDPNYQPEHREKPYSFTWKILDDLRRNPRVAPKPLAARHGDFSLPPAWKLATLRNQDFHYLWNVGKPWLDELAAKDPKRILVPFNVDPAWIKQFRAAYGGKTDVPIFGDSRIVPAFHGAGPDILDNANFIQWLNANPTRAWGNMMNYTGPKALSVLAKANWLKYRERYIGNISGENLGYFGFDAKALATKVKAAKSREEALKILTDLYMSGNAAKLKAIFGEAVKEHYQHTIPCLSADMTAYAHLCREWGARTMGFENTAVTPCLAMRLAFLRGGARQYGGTFATYRSSNFGDSATIFSEQSLFAHPKYVYDNFYDPWAGAGMTWYKFDIWHQYLAGSAMFYHEQGFDEFWIPGGQSAGLKPIQLSPKGLLVDQFLRMTRGQVDRGTSFTPIAFLLDQAHGWDPNGYAPSYFGLDASNNTELLSFNHHARMLKEWFKVAYHPYGPKEAELNTGVNPTNIPGVFGNIFDVLVTSPTKMDVLDSYPVVILSGQVALSAAWGKKLASYVQKGGTLIVNADQLSGPGVGALGLPKLGKATEANLFQWQPAKRKVLTQSFRYYPIQGGMALATSAVGDALASVFTQGKGRLVFLSIPGGLGIDGSATPLVGLVIAHVRQGLLPLEVHGEVEWLVNKTKTGWLVTLINPAGSKKPQHGMVVTDYKQKRKVRVVSEMKWTKSREWFTGKELPVVKKGKETEISVIVPAGGIRVLEVR